MLKMIGPIGEERELELNSEATASKRASMAG